MMQMECKVPQIFETVYKRSAWWFQERRGGKIDWTHAEYKQHLKGEGLGSVPAVVYYRLYQKCNSTTLLQYMCLSKKIQYYFISYQTYLTDRYKLVIRRGIILSHITVQKSRRNAILSMLFFPSIYNVFFRTNKQTVVIERLCWLCCHFFQYSGY